MKKIKHLLKYLSIYLAIAGLVTFSLFMIEESFQCVQFGTWAAQDAKRWDIVMDGVVLMEKITTTLKVINYTVGYIQPLSWFAYRAYAKASEYYTKSLKALVFAHEPRLLAGRYVEFEFRPHTIERKRDGTYIYKSRAISIITTQQISNGIISAKGVVETSNNGQDCIIDMTKINE